MELRSSGTPVQARPRGSPELVLAVVGGRWAVLLTSWVAGYRVALAGAGVAALSLFDGSGAEWPAEILRMGRSEVAVQLRAREMVQRELAHAVSLCVVMPANDRMDGVIEKAT